jgi:DNA polymerase I
MSSVAAQPTGSAPVTPTQRESIGRLLARLNSLGAGIRDIWIADSEFHSQAKSSTGLFDTDGGLQVPVCFVFFNPITSEEIRQFYTSLKPYPPCPISIGSDTLFVAFSAQAELLTMLRLWGAMPSRILDLEIEWLAMNNEEYRLRQLKSEARSANKDGDVSPLSLLGVCAIHGISTRDQGHKDTMRDLILRAGPWTDEEVQQILDYCAEDVYDTAALLAALWEKIQDVFYCRERIDGLKAALHRGRSMQGFAWMRHVGIPIDVEMNARLSKNFERIMNDLYLEIRDEFPVFNTDSYDIAPSKWKDFLKSKGWLDNPEHPWPMTKGGKKRDNRQPKRDVKRTIPSMALVYPELKKLSTVLEIRSCTKLGLRFPVGSDNRHRVNFWAYGSVTGRCTPSSAHFMLAGGSPAFRHLAKPAEGEILIEADWSAQEIWIAAYLSGDRAMQRMLRGADPYISFGETAGVVPPGSMQQFIDEHGYEKGVKLCKKKYEAERARLKAITLGVLYGKTVYTVASECGITTREAALLLQTHKRNFPKFWQWISWMVNEALATHRITTKLGWQRWILPKKERDAHKDEESRNKKIQNSLQNFQMQAHGAEMLRLACIYAAEKGLAICAPLHDAIFAVASVEDEQKALADLRDCMECAAKDLLGVAIPIEFFVTRYPDHFVPDDKPMAVTVWDRMMQSLESTEKNNQENGDGKNESGHVA